MSVAVAALLGLAVAGALLGAVATLRLGAMSRLHAVTFVNVVTGLGVLLAAGLADGVTSRAAKLLLAWVATLIFGALSAHVSGRAIHLRGGERR